MSDDTQIASRISDTRPESSFAYRDERGINREVRIVDYPTPDDIARQGMMQAAGEIALGTGYSSTMDYDMVTEMIRTRVPVRRTR
jgi:hypothetical protein